MEDRIDSRPGRQKAVKQNLRNRCTFNPNSRSLLVYILCVVSVGSRTSHYRTTFHELKSWYHCRGNVRRKFKEYIQEFSPP